MSDPVQAQPAGPSAHLSTSAFALVAPYRAVLDIRYYLEGVYITPHPQGRGALVAATDGRQLAIVYDEAATASGPVILRCSPELARAAASRRDCWITIVNDRLHLLANHGEELFIQPGPAVLPGKFPDIYRVLPAAPDKLKPLLQGAFSHALMSRLLATAKQLAGRRGFCGMTHWQEPSDLPGAAALLTRFDAEQNLLVITMPLRGDFGPTGCLPPLIAAAKAITDRGAST